jgi:GTP cyclohydrolase I
MKVLRSRKRAVRALRSAGLPAIEPHIRAILEEVGEDPDREGLVKTPARVARAFEHLTRGYHQDPKSVINGALFVEDYSEMILCRDIDFFSLCEHHLLPFFGKAQIAYIPKNHIVGLSKLARLVEVYARRLQVQERMTTQIADALVETLSPRGVIVVIEAEHLCMSMRGVRKVGAKTITSAVRGQLLDPATRAEAMGLITASPR